MLNNSSVPEITVKELKKSIDEGGKCLAMIRHWKSALRELLDVLNEMEAVNAYENYKERNKGGG